MLMYMYTYIYAYTFIYLRNYLSHKDCDSTHTYVHGRDAVKGVPTSALSPLPERMGVQEHTSLCGSKALLSTCSLLRGPKREQQAPNHWGLHKKGQSWKSLISKPGHDA